MKTLIHIEDVQLDGTADRLLKNKTRKFARHVENYEKGPAQLQVKLRKDGTHGILIDLDAVVGGNHLHVSKNGEEASTTIKEATVALLRLFDKERLKRSPKLRARATSRLKRFFEDRTTWRRYIHDTPATPDLAREVADEFPRLKFIITTELAQRIAAADVEPGVIDPIEIIDEAIAVDWPALTGSEGGPVFRRILEDALRILDEKITQWNDETEHLLSTETDFEDNGTLALSYLGDEVFDFWMPDEDLVLGDVLVDPEARDPEEIVANKEARKVLFGALTKLPSNMRVAFAASVLDEERLDDIADLMRLTRSEVKEMVADAKQRLAEILATPNIPMTGDLVDDLYRSLGKTFRVDLNALIRVH